MVLDISDEPTQHLERSSFSTRDVIKKTSLCWAR
jgi:hypothetical protein